MNTEDEPNYICKSCGYFGDDVAREDACGECGTLYAPNQDGNLERCPSCGSDEYLVRCPKCGADEDEGFTNTGLIEPSKLQEWIKTNE